LRVITPEAEVRVVGTRFEVTRDEEQGKTSVFVEEGRVEVRSTKDGAVQALGPAEALVLGGSQLEKAGPEDAGESIQSPVGTETHPPPTEEAETQGGFPEGVARSIADIRTHIRQGKVKEARAQIRMARAQARHDRLRLAELAIVEVEADLAEGRPAVAIERYLAVSRHFKGTRQADAATFAAAQLALDHDPNQDRGTALLRRYLEDNPRGRYREDARRLLQALGERDGAR
jgi:hypothetical protein